MCGIVGFVNFKNDISKYTNILSNMTKSLIGKEKSESEIYIKNQVGFAQKKLVTTNSNQHMTKQVEGNEYSIVYDGQIYNKKELKQTLIEKGVIFDDNSDNEILLNAYIYYGKDIVHYLNGIFAIAIWDSQKEELFIARDHLGVKPLFYTMQNNSFIFASEIKAIFQYPGFQKVLKSQGISELFGIGPAHTSGTTVFDNIFELKPAHFLIYNKSGLHFERYWKLESKPHTDNLNKTCDKIEFLLKDAIINQLDSDKHICTFLSGGLDSSIITKFASDFCYEKNLPTLDTYSIDYIDNDKNFVKSDFQPNSDNYYIELMANKLNTNNHNIVVDTPELADYLYDAMIARDMPGMADIDSSLLLFCKNVKPTAGISLTGECADEIFGGYPWFFRGDALNSGTFPWSIAISERQMLLNPSISKKIDLQGYIDYRYKESLDEVEILDCDSLETAEKRKISYLTLNWFMQTLLDRSDRMARYNDFEIRVPFCDYRLAEYVWNIPWELKSLNGREKGLLRHISRKFLPLEIVDRKKSPYPKTHNPTYLAKVKSMLSNIMEKPNSPINYLLNRKYILELLDSDGNSFTKPWFGQLMTGPQLMAYLCQVNMWLEFYKPRIEL